jgi:hypothetical protein
MFINGEQMEVRQVASLSLQQSNEMLYTFGIKYFIYVICVETLFIIMINRVIILDINMPDGWTRKPMKKSGKMIYKTYV